MSYVIDKKPLLKAKIFAVLLKLADDKGSIDVKNADLLWSLDNDIENYLWELNEQNSIHYESYGEDGFEPVIFCEINSHTTEQLLLCLSQISNDKNILDSRIQSLLAHNPKKLQQDIAESEKHIIEVKKQLANNSILEPLLKPLLSVEEHFSSIKRVAETYDDVYRNILKPVQEEGKSGVKATVRWAIISIIASWAITNYSQIEKILSGIIG